ncbi:MAG: MFS transporter [Actinobacteria bacterium]|nr:MFS transporter [Actinomycetota bacterium]NDE53165.1 MFS transporter [Actinomycetota bacterium]
MPTTTYKRDKVFWLAALQTGAFGIFMGGFGPALPLLQEAQGTSAAIAGLHGTALGVASIIAGAFNAHIVHRYGRMTTVWLGLITFNIGALGFVLFPRAWQTILAIFIAGIGLSVTVNNTFMKLSIHFADHSARATSQANGVNSAFVLLGNFIIGVIASSSFSWKLGLLLCIPFTIVLYLLLGRQEEYEYIPEESGRQKGSLSLKYWVSWVGMTFCIAAEFAIAFWAAALLRERTDMSAPLATTLVLAFPLGMMIGRWFGTYLLPSLDIDQRLKLIVAIQGLSFLVFWASDIALASFIALFFVGFGTSMQFALSTLRLLRFGANKPDLAIGKASWGAGIAIALSPFFLGFLADKFGIVNAFLMVPAIVICAFVIVVLLPSDHEVEKR